MKTRLVTIPSIKDPIKKSPGFHKKELADFKLDIMGLCGFGCTYCSSNSGNYLRINRDKFAAMTAAQIGERALPATDPSLSFRWGDFEERLGAQLKNKPPTWGDGRTLVFSQLTDAFSPWAVADGLTARTLDKVIRKTSFRIRVLTKSAAVGTPKWIEAFARWPGRFVVGLSIGTLDDEWARRVEIGTSSPTARLRALHALQDAGVPTYGMLCPVFPDTLDGDGVERLVSAIRPDRCEMVWSEPYNDRDNWRQVAVGHEEGSPARRTLEAMFEGRNARSNWSEYAMVLYRRVHAALGEHASKHRYLLYQDGMLEHAKGAMRGAEGVLFQSAEVTS